MTNFVRVSSSEILSSGRLDPKFHIMAQRLKPVVEKLEVRLTAEEAEDVARTLFHNTPREISRACLADLQMGNPSSLPGIKEIERIFRNHPFLAVAALAEARSASLKHLEEKIQNLQEQHQILSESMARLPLDLATPAPTRGGPKR